MAASRHGQMRAPQRANEETMNRPVQAGGASGPLLLADISGYTGFLQSVTDAHRDDAFAGGEVPDAYGLVSSLLDGIIERIAPPFTISKLEGDAVFAFARDEDDIPAGRCPPGLPRARATRPSASSSRAPSRSGPAGATPALAWTGSTSSSCSTRAATSCSRSGAAASWSDPEVVMAHRLLKNHAAELVGPAYALITEAAASRLAVPATVRTNLRRRTSTTRRSLPASTR